MKPTTSHIKNNTNDVICVYCHAVCLPNDLVVKNEKPFCCHGCATLYEVVSTNGEGFLDQEISIEYKQFDLPEVFNQLVDFQTDEIYKIEVNTPAIHCSSCVSLLEDLPEINPLIHRANVNFEERKLTVVADKKFPLSGLAMLLSKLGYPPQFDVSKKAALKQKEQQKVLLRKLAVAGFAFGNIMMFSMPHYFGLKVGSDSFFEGIFKYFNVALSILVLFYPAQDYLKTAYQSLKVRKNHIDIPIAIGILAIWGWSMFEIFTNKGFGYLDSLAGLIFFLLIGKWYQSKMYAKISFERNLTDFLPISVRKKHNENVLWQRVDELHPGDVVVVKNGEIIPVNGNVVSGKALVDYSFVTGESIAEKVGMNKPIYIGGKQTAGVIEIQITERQDLSKIWAAWKTPKTKNHEEVHWTSVVSKYFTPAVLIIALSALVVWFFIDAQKALFVFSSVLIVACPCALALSSPFTFGSISRVLGKRFFYLKNANIVEKLAGINHIVFDKTGTLTDADSVSVSALIYKLNEHEESILKSVVSQSTHPLSQLIFGKLKDAEIQEIDSFEEIDGLGILANVNGISVKLGSQLFITGQQAQNETSVFVEMNGEVKAKFVFANKYRKGLAELLGKLGENYKLSVLSGDNDGEAENLKKLYPNFEVISFYNTPESKKQFIDKCHANGDKTLMIGDGLNDQVALNHSDVGLAVAHNINGFYPSSDGILLPSGFDQLAELLQLAKYSKNILKTSLAFSVFYNLLGIAFAVTGVLTPVVAAILMPLSSVSVVGLVTALVSLKSKNLNMRQEMLEEVSVNTTVSSRLQSGLSSNVSGLKSITK
ncbi:MAG: HAD-IC family P-type ATPase [Flavobacteriales bacterium]|nr:HAD-IC family P-type ATPase [Flavobacteriales bacterium]